MSNLNCTVMNQETIGANAGIVWNLLNEAKEQTCKALKKASKLKDKDLFLALGWLAREGKIRFTDTENDVIVELC